MGAVVVMDLQSGGDGPAIWERWREVNMSDVMEQIQSLLAQYVNRSEIKGKFHSCMAA